MQRLSHLHGLSRWPYHFAALGLQEARVHTALEAAVGLRQTSELLLISIRDMTPKLADLLSWMMRIYRKIRDDPPPNNEEVRPRPRPSRPSRVAPAPVAPVARRARARGRAHGQRPLSKRPRRACCSARCRAFATSLRCIRLRVGRGVGGGRSRYRTCGRTGASPPPPCPPTGALIVSHPPSHRGPHRVPSYIASYSYHTHASRLVGRAIWGAFARVWQMPPLNHAAVAAYLIDSASHPLGLPFDAVTDTFADPPATDPPTPPGGLVEDDLSQLSGLPPTERVAAALRRLETDLSACFSPVAQVRDDDDVPPARIHYIMRCWPSPPGVMLRRPRPEASGLLVSATSGLDPEAQSARQQDQCRPHMARPQPAPCWPYAKPAPPVQYSQAEQAHPTDQHNARAVLQDNGPRWV